MSFYELLQNTTASQLIDVDRKLISVTRDATVEYTLQILADNRVLSVPVEDPESAQGFSDFVDVLDIVSHLIHVCKDLNVANHKVEQFTEKKVGEIVNLSKKDPFMTVEEKSTAAEVLDLFAKGIHRVALRNAEGKITNVISQFDFLKFAVLHQDKYASVLNQSVKDLKLVKSWVFFVRKTERALVCYKKMEEHNVNALCIVDEAGKLDAQLSSSDLRGLNSESFKALRYPVSDFLHLRGQRNKSSCTGSATFQEVLTQLVEQVSHRLWVEDAAGFPVGVISLTDVCATLKQAHQ